jgi:hypothetical protein
LVVVGENNGICPRELSLALSKWDPEYHVIRIIKEYPRADACLIVDILQTAM